MIETTPLGEGVLLRMQHARANALDVPFMAALTGALESIARSDARSVVLTGTGGIFSAGVDLVKLRDGGTDYVATFLPAMHACFRALDLFEKPVVAAVNGHAIAGGCILTCACDHRIMARGKGRIGVPEHLVGVPFPWLPLEIMRRSLPASSLSGAVLLGELYDPDQALGRGVVDEVVDEAELITRAGAVAARLGAITPFAFASAKRALKAQTIAGLEHAAPAHDREVAAAWAGDEVRARVADYVKRTLGR